ncbi:MAG: LLM class flavin-dependent oxidoreductase [Burkholderiales bacterium]
MQFSFSLTPTMDLNDYAGFVERAQSWGFDMIWCPDQGFLRDPFVALARIAATTTIPLGLAVTNPYARHPIQIARAAASLADFRKGEFILALGAGELARMRRKMGAPEAPLVPTLRDTITTLRRLFAGETVSIANPVFKLDEIGLGFKPTSPIPIYVASTSPEAFALAGELADGVIVGDVASPAAMREIVRTVHEGARKAGRDPNSIKVVAWVSTLVTTQRSAVYEMLRLPVIGRAASNTARQTRLWLDIPETSFAALKSALQTNQKSISPEIVPDSLIDAMSLVGTAEEIASRVRALEDEGVHMIGCRMPAALADDYDFETNIRAIAEQVIPHARKEA